MADTLVFDMSSMAEGTPQIMVRKDWLSILDNQNQNYQGNQSVIDTSQLANSNKYLNYREAYLTVPLLLTLTQQVGSTGSFAPATPATSADYAVGLKNWYGSVVHSFTLDYNGTTIIQQTPFAGLWNTFKLMTSLSYNDLLTQGSMIGFYPDSSKAWGSVATNGIVNNQNASVADVVSGVLNQFSTTNTGLLQRQQAWNFDPAGVPAGIVGGAGSYGAILGTNSLNLLWKSYIFNKTNATGGPPTTSAGVWQCAITAVIMLKHLHSFFERVPLLKGVFMKMTLNLNQSSVSFTSAGAGGAYTNMSVISPLGGVSPLMIASPSGANGASTCFVAGNYVLSLAVGATVLNTSQLATGTMPTQSSPLGRSILLNVPAYTFNPVFETSYLSSPIKKIVYEDIYQYQVLGQTPNQTFNNLITNGIANIKSVLVLPFYSNSYNTASLRPIQSPLDPAGGGPTSPLSLLTQFNIQISGQNAIYNTERYSYEQFINQLYGQNAVNGGMTDGLTSGLVGMTDFEMEYCYYYVNVGRMLPVEEAVPKSVNILGTNTTAYSLDLYVFVSYGVEVSVDILTGARV
jgi:hypothetical protein